jgi:hypothetical protein
MGGDGAIYSYNNIFTTMSAHAPYNSGVTHSYNQYFNISGTVTGTGEVTSDPLFTSDGWHIKLASPVNGSGDSSHTTIYDRDGLLRPTPPSKGAFEYAPAAGGGGGQQGGGTPSGSIGLRLGGIRMGGIRFW